MHRFSDPPCFLPRDCSEQNGLSVKNVIRTCSLDHFTVLCKVGATESRDHSACPNWLYCVQPRLFDWPPSNLRHGTSHHQGLKPDQIGSEWPNSILVRDRTSPMISVPSPFQTGPNMSHASRDVHSARELVDLLSEPTGRLCKALRA